jgi:hypothetical protein
VLASDYVQHPIYPEVGQENMAGDLHFASSSEDRARTRDTVLISHANPEDNEFSLWLALQLANEGYKVWCDLTRLLGGEVFWDDIENVIRNSAAKVLYVLSRTSNAKDGPLSELHLAQSVVRKEKIKDFVVPLHVDSLPHGEVTIELTRVNSTEFSGSWASGLHMLLKRLEEHSVPKDAAFNRTAVNAWWRANFSATQGVRQEPEDLLSNWFPAVGLPEHVYFHSLSRCGIGKVEVSHDLPYPAFQEDISLITFAPAEAFENKLGQDIYIPKAGDPLSVRDLLADSESLFGKHLFRLLRLAWEHLLKERNLPIHELANGMKMFYFEKDKVPADKVFFTDLQGKERFRGMVGYSTRTNRSTGASSKRFWHFGLEARPQVHPVPAFIMKPHVVFSNDGKTIWSSKKRLAAARQSQCKGWWNDVWRDRTLAAVSHLADGQDSVAMAIAPALAISVARFPIFFRSPVAYTDPQELDEDAIAAIAEDYGRNREHEDDAFEDENA